jgi:hypothetical protein
MKPPVVREDADTVLPGCNPPAGTVTVRGCWFESWAVKLVIGLVPVFLMVIEKAMFPSLSLTRFAD